MGLIFWLSSQSKIPGPPLPFGADKVAHLAAFMILAWLAWRAFFLQLTFAPIKRFAVVLAVILTGVYGILDEIHQMYVPGRSFDYWDMAVDFLGGVVFVAVYALWIQPGHASRALTAN